MPRPPRLPRSPGPRRRRLPRQPRVSCPRPSSLSVRATSANLRSRRGVLVAPGNIRAGTLVPGRATHEEATPMTAPLTDTVALITGSSSGIGAATARRLAAEGAAVSLVARRRDRLDELAATITGAGGTALVVEADVTSEEQAAAAVQRTLAELGRLDTLVSNAGVMLLGPALDTPVAEWDQMVAVNVQGMLYVAHAALPHLVRAAADSPRGVADLVTISSTAGRVARPGSSVYNLAKFGANAFTEALRQEMIGLRVRVSVVEAGSVDTELRP